MSRSMRVVAATAALLGAAVVPATGAAASAPHFALGLQPSARYRPIVRASNLLTTAALPASVNLTAWAPPAGNQGAVGSCVSWATDYTAMGWYLNKAGNPGPPLAPMYTYAQIAQGNDQGSSYYETFWIAQQQGVDTLSDYTQGNFDYTTQPTDAEKLNAQHWKLAGFTDVATTAPEIEAALAAEQPVALAIPVYNNFFSVSAANSDYDAIAGGLAGYHAVTALGYDSYGVTIENSWGSGWGNNGFARLSWSFITNYALEAHVITGVTYSPAIAPANAPAVTQVSPGVGPVAGGQTVTLTGSNFATGSTVSFDSFTASNIVVNDTGTQITATAPAHAAGSVAVSVDGSTGTSAASAAATYIYAGVPTIASVSKRGGPTAGGTLVSIAGTGLFGATVAFGATSKPAAVNAGGTQLSVASPPHAAGPVAITVNAAYGSAGAGGFTYFAAPTITAATAAHTPPSVGTRVTIVGTHLYGATVTIGRQHATVVSASLDGTHLVVSYPAGVPRPAAWVVVHNMVGSASTNKRFG
jgi:hypothetical protein